MGVGITHSLMLIPGLLCPVVLDHFRFLLLHIDIWQTYLLGISEQDIYLCKQGTAEKKSRE